MSHNFFPQCLHFSNHIFVDRQTKRQTDRKRETLVYRLFHSLPLSTHNTSQQCKHHTLLLNSRQSFTICLPFLPCHTIRPKFPQYPSNNPPHTHTYTHTQAYTVNTILTSHSTTGSQKTLQRHSAHNVTFTLNECSR